MKQFKLEQLQDIENNTIYYACAFYLDKDEKYRLENIEFNDCSFRTSVKFRTLTNCNFHNCTFSSEVVLE